MPAETRGVTVAAATVARRLRPVMHDQLATADLASRSPTTGRARGDSAVAGTILVAGVALAVGVVATKGSGTAGLLDLRIYLKAAESIGDGGLYEFEEVRFGLGFTYPPFAGLLLSFLRGVPVRVVEYAWTVASVLAWLVLLSSLWTRVVLARAPTWAQRHSATCITCLWFVSLLGAPVWTALNQGQVGILLWVAVAFDALFVFDDRRRAGALTGLAAAFKVVPIVAVPLYLIAGRVRAATIMLLSFASATAAATVVLPSESRHYWGQLLWGTRVGERGDERNSSALGALSRVLGDGWPTIAVFVVLAATLASVGALGFRSAVRREAPLSAILILGSVMSLLSPIAWAHHLAFLSLLLLFPFLTWRDRPRESALALGGLILLLVDPLGAGNADNALWSLARALAMVAVLVAHRVLIHAEQRVTPGPAEIRAFDRTARGGSSPGRR